MLKLNIETKKIISENRKFIDIVRCHQDIERNSLAKLLGISLPTLSNIINELKEKEILLTKSMDNLKIGKDSLIINPKIGIYVGISIGASQIKITLVNFDFSILSKDSFKTLQNQCKIFTEEFYTNKEENPIGYVCIPTPDHYDKLVDKIDNIMQNCIILDQYLLENNSCVMGIGFAITGAIDNKAKRIVKSYNLDCLENLTISYNTLIFGNRLSYFNKNNIDIAFENIARAAVISEKYNLYNRENINYLHRNKKNIACVYLGSGIGSGLILDNVLYRGTSNFSELGHIQVCDPVFDFSADDNNKNEIDESCTLDKSCTCGSKNCLEYKIRTKVLKMTLKEFKTISASKLKEKMHNDENKDNKMKLLGYYIGNAANTLINILNLDLVIFTGKLTVLMDDLWKYLNQTIASNKVTYTTTDCSIVVSAYGSLAPSIGAAISSANSDENKITWYIENNI